MLDIFLAIIAVASLAEAWIEIYGHPHKETLAKLSFPSRKRGLKYIVLL